MTRVLQWPATGRAAYGACDDTSSGCEAFKIPREDVRYGHGGRYGPAALCQALNPEAPFGRGRVQGVRLQRRPQAVRDPLRGGSEDSELLAILADRNTKCSSPRHQRSPPRRGFHAPMCFEALDSPATSPGTGIGRHDLGASTASQRESIEHPRYRVVEAGDVTDALTRQDALRRSMASHAQRQDPASVR
jgi:hypothetical protein